MTRWQVTLRFNGRLSGSGQEWSGVVEAEGLQEAVTEASSAALRDPRHGQSICHVGVTVEEANDEATRCEACGDPDDEKPFCEGCDCCQECCNCTETDCDCESCKDRRNVPDDDPDPDPDCGWWEQGGEKEFWRRG